MENGDVLIVTKLDRLGRNAMDIRKTVELFPRQNLSKTFDGILAWDSFFHLCHSDQRDMFAIFSANAKPGTALMFNASPEEGEAFGQLQGELLAHSSLSPSEYASLMQHYGFRQSACCRRQTV
jgi:hypothetical protein